MQAICGTKVYNSLLVGLKPALQLTHPRPQLRHRLDLARVAVRGLITPNHLAHRVLRNIQIPGDLLDRNAPHQMIPTDPRNRLHNQHLPHLVCPNNKVCSKAQNQGGQFWTPITPNRGSIFHAEQHSRATNLPIRCIWLTGAPPNGRLPAGNASSSFTTVPWAAG